MIASTMKKVASLLFLLVVASCSPANVAGPLADSGVDASADGATSITAACTDRAYAYCTQLETCSTTAVTTRFGNVQTCKKYLEATCESSISAPSSAATPAQAEACATAEASWACDDIIHSQNVPPACLAPAGPLANGTPCTVGQQCQTEWCSRPLGSECGVCAPSPQAGDPCNGGACPSNLSCTAAICAAYAELGDPCSASSPCDSGLTCVGGVCQAGVTTVDSACDPAGPGCDMFSGLACNAQSSTCKTLVLVPPGQACGQVANQSDACIVGECLRGVCVGLGALGDPCDIVAGPGCASSLRCIVTSEGGTAGTCHITGAGSCP